jgi:hypothetical protein
VWRRALTKTVRIPVENQHEGTRLRFRLYELRAALKEDDHPDYPSASRVSLSVVLDKDTSKYFVVAEHADARLDEILDRAGIPNPASDAPSLLEEHATEYYNISPAEVKPIKQDS